jgi:adenylate kinase family enzyme
LFWRQGWTRAPAEEARRGLATAVAGERWILEGNFLDADGGAGGRFERADTVVFLDLPRRRCLWRILSRRVRDRGRSRRDLPEGCREGFDPGLLWWIWRYPSADRPRVLTLLDGLDSRVAVHRLRSGLEIKRFLDALWRPGVFAPGRGARHARETVTRISRKCDSACKPAGRGEQRGCQTQSRK